MFKAVREADDDVTTGELDSISEEVGLMAEAGGGPGAASRGNGEEIAFETRDAAKLNNTRLSNGNGRLFKTGLTTVALRTQQAEGYYTFVD
jgi:hypothetical protein